MSVCVVMHWRFCQRLRVLLVAALVWCAASPGQAEAYSCVVPECIPHCQDPVPYKLGVVSEDLGADATESILIDSMEVWANASCTGLQVEYQGRTTMAPETGSQIVEWLEDDWIASSGTIGRTTISTRNGRSCFVSRMLLNGEDYEWVQGQPTTRREVNAFTILAHEAGHYLGLAHTPIRQAMMFPSYSNNIKDLQPDDVEGICRIYPADGTSGGLVRPGATPPMDAEDPGPEPPNEPPVPGTEPMPIDPSEPPGEDVGASCEVSSDCATGLCAKSGGRGFCTKICTEGACGDDFSCEAFAGIRLCVPKAEPGQTPAEDPGSGTTGSFPEADDLETEDDGNEGSGPEGSGPEGSGPESTGVETAGDDAGDGGGAWWQVLPQEAGVCLLAAC